MYTPDQYTLINTGALDEPQPPVRWLLLKQISHDTKLGQDHLWNPLESHNLQYSCQLFSPGDTYLEGGGTFSAVMALDVANWTDSTFATIFCEVAGLFTSFTTSQIS